MIRSLAKLVVLSAVALPLAATGCSEAPFIDDEASETEGAADDEGAVAQVQEELSHCQAAWLVFLGTGFTAAVSTVAVGTACTAAIPVTFGGATIACAPAAGFTLGAWASATLAASNVQMMCQGRDGTSRQIAWFNQPSSYDGAPVVLAFNGIELANKLVSTRLGQQVGLNARCSEIGQEGSHKKIRCYSDNGQCQTSVPQHREQIKKGTLGSIKRQLWCLGDDWLRKVR